MAGEAFEELVEWLAAESPVEGDCCAVVAVLEAEESFLECGEVREVLGFDDFALNGGEEDLDLVRPRRVHGQVVLHVSRGDDVRVGPGDDGVWPDRIWFWVVGGVRLTMSG